MKSASSSPKLFFKEVLLNSCFQALLFQDEMFHRSFLYKYKSKELFNYFINLDYIDKIFVVLVRLCSFNKNDRRFECYYFFLRNQTGYFVCTIYFIFCSGISALGPQLILAGFT